MMKRACWEWSGLTSLTVALACLVYWAVSSLSDAADFSLVFGGGAAEIVAGDGQLNCCDASGNLEVIESVRSGQAFDPPPAAVRGLHIPGFHFDLIRFAEGFAIWSVRFSLLIPGILLLLLGGLLWRRHRQELRAAARNEPPPGDLRT